MPFAVDVRLQLLHLFVDARELDAKIFTKLIDAFAHDPLLATLGMLLDTKGVLFDLDQFGRPTWPSRTPRWPRRPSNRPHASGGHSGA